VAVGSALTREAVRAGLAVVGDVVWPDGSSVRVAPNDRLSLVWTALAHTCSSRRYSLSSARFKSTALPRQVRNLVRIVPKTLQRRSTEAELGQIERMRRANWASGVNGWFGCDMASQTSSGLRFVPYNIKELSDVHIKG